MTGGRLELLLAVVICALALAALYVAIDTVTDAIGTLVRLWLKERP